MNELLNEVGKNKNVEWKTLGEIATITRGGNFQKKDFCAEGVPCIHYGQIYTKYYLHTNKTITFVPESVANKSKKAKTKDIIMAVTSENIEDVCKCVAWLGEGEIAVSGHTAIIHHNQNAKYLAYFFHTRMFFEQKKKYAHGTKVIEVTPNQLENILIPIPPLEEQKRIADILDDYTAKNEELIYSLQQELTARKKQYEYYRDKLLNAEYGTEEYKNLEDCCTVLDNRRKPVTKAVREFGEYPYYGANGIQDYVSSYIFDGQFVLVGEDGSVLTKDGKPVITWAEGKIWVNNHAHIIESNGTVELRFLYYYLQTIDITLLVHGNIPKLTGKDFRALKIPLPPLTEQKRIVSILDRFDTLCNDISEGLTAEIEARKKQYEYYRDKLLTFEIRHA